MGAWLKRVVVALIIAMAPIMGAGAQVVVVLNSNSDSMSLIDPNSYTEIKRVPIGRAPHHLILTPDRRELLVGNTSGNELAVLDPITGEVRRRVPGIADPYQLGFSPDAKWFAVAALRQDRVDIYEAAGFKLLRRIPVREAPSHLVFSGDSRFVYVTLQDSGDVVAVEVATQQIVWQKRVGPAPAGIALHPDGERLIVGLIGANGVAVMRRGDGALLQTIPTGKGAHNLWHDRKRGRIYVSNRIEGTISAIDYNSMEVVDRLEVPGGPDDMEFAKGGREMWVTGRFSQRVLVYDFEARAVTRIIPVGRSPHGIFFFPSADSVAALSR